MEFVVMGVDHKLDNNTWTTNIRAISKPKAIHSKTTSKEVRDPFTPRERNNQLETL